MGDLSWNPCTWTPSNIAESAVEGLSGSEFLGDLAGAGLSFMTGDVLGGLDQVADGLDNVASFLGDSRVIDAAKDAFLGSVDSPSDCGCIDWAGWGDEEPTEITQGGSGKPNETAGSGDVKDLDLSGLSLEEMVFTLLMAAIKDKQGEVRDLAKESAGAQKDLKAGRDKLKGLSGDAKEAAQNDLDTKTDARDNSNRKLQMANDQLKEMSQLLTGLMSSMNQMNSSVIQNIR